MVVADATDLELSFGAVRAGSYPVTVTGLGQTLTSNVVIPPVGAVALLPRRRGEPPPSLRVIGRDLFESVLTGEALALYPRGLGPGRDLGHHPPPSDRRRGCTRTRRDPLGAMVDDPVFLAASRGTTIVRTLPSRRPLRELLVQGRVRILVVLAAPSDLPALDVAAERRRIEAQLAPVLNGGLAQVEWLQPATLDDLQRAIGRGCHVLHFSGHSSLDPAGQGVLALEHLDGTSHLVGADLLTTAIDRRTDLRLAVLNSCSGARTAAYPCAAIATSLVALGLPAVVAMQFDVTDAAAVEFGGVLYGALLDAGSVIEDAVAAARFAMLSAGREPDWVAPVLYAAGTRPRLFDLSLIGWYTLDGSPPRAGRSRAGPGSSGWPSTIRWSGRCICWATTSNGCRSARIARRGTGRSPTRAG